MMLLTGAPTCYRTEKWVKGWFYRKRAQSTNRRHSRGKRGRPSKKAAASHQVKKEQLDSLPLSSGEEKVDCASSGIVGPSEVDETSQDQHNGPTKRHSSATLPSWAHSRHSTAVPSTSTPNLLQIKTEYRDILLSSEDNIPTPVTSSPPQAQYDASRYMTPLPVSPTFQAITSTSPAYHCFKNKNKLVHSPTTPLRSISNLQGHGQTSQELPTALPHRGKENARAITLVEASTTLPCSTNESKERLADGRNMPTWGLSSSAQLSTENASNPAQENFVSIEPAAHLFPYTFQLSVNRLTTHTNASCTDSKFLQNDHSALSPAPRNSQRFAGADGYRFSNTAPTVLDANKHRFESSDLSSGHSISAANSLSQLYTGLGSQHRLSREYRPTPLRFSTLPGEEALMSGATDHRDYRGWDDVEV
jgi:hypothetical protein